MDEETFYVFFKNKFILLNLYIIILHNFNLKCPSRLHLRRTNQFVENNNDYLNK